ncbi:MAG: type IV pilus assembly protein PilE [Bermanella sp.]|jgi:type IV pilus assembly protein PilE
MKYKGFSLIELMVVISIIGILASIGYPAYQSNVMRASRGDGMTALMDIMRAQENFFANEFTYTDDLNDLNYGSSYTTSSGKYIITASTCANDVPLTQCIRLTATAQQGQVDDGNLTLDSQGNKTHGTKNTWPK